MRPDSTDRQVAEFARRLMNDPALVVHNLPPKIELQEVWEPCPGEWIRPKGQEGKGTIIYFHGGGYVAGTARNYRPLNASIVRDTGYAVFSPEYRLAPEHPYPAALNDALAAYEYVRRTTPPENIVFVGDSAGGGLLLATMLASRDKGLPLPRKAVCFSPFTDLSASGESLVTNDRNCVMFYGDSIRRIAPLYVEAEDPRDPYLSPVYGDFTGFPPLLLFVSTNEVLYDDTIRVADKARSAGVDVQVEIGQDLPHVWPIFIRELPEAKKALAITTGFILDQKSPGAH